MSVGRTNGLTAEQYASELGINAKTLQFWTYKLVKRAPSAQRARRRPRIETMLPLIEVQPASELTPL